MQRRVQVGHICPWLISDHPPLTSPITRGARSTPHCQLPALPYALCKSDFALYRLARSDGGCGFARALVEAMCILARERLCGVIWRIGPGVDGVAASSGHWVCASYIYGAGDWSKHRWVFKGSVGGRSRDMPLSELLGVLDGAEKEQREFSAFIDLR